LHRGPVVIARLSYFLEYRLYFSIRYAKYNLYLHHRRRDGKGQRAKVLALEEEVINSMQQVLGAVECRKNMWCRVFSGILYFLLQYNYSIIFAFKFPIAGLDLRS
jgi:hypothetical protein